MIRQQLGMGAADKVASSLGTMQHLYRRDEAFAHLWEPGAPSGLLVRVSAMGSAGCLTKGLFGVVPTSALCHRPQHRARRRRACIRATGVYSATSSRQLNVHPSRTICVLECTERFLQMAAN